jgi:hypothetical protein
VRKPERLPLSAARPRCEVLRIVSETDQDGKGESASIASKKPESEPYAERWVRSVKEECLSRLIPFWRDRRRGERCSNIWNIAWGAQPSGQRQSDSVSFAAGGKGEHGSCAVSRTTGRPAEVVRQGSGIRLTGQPAMGSRSALIVRMPGISLRPPGPDLSSTREEQ